MGELSRSSVQFSCMHAQTDKVKDEEVHAEWDTRMQVNVEFPVNIYVTFSTAGLSSKNAC